jgi:hypothetical protein
MKKWIALVMVGGSTSLFGLSGATAPGAAATALETDPCPSCCPPEICTYNGPSFDGTDRTNKVERLGQ